VGAGFILARRVWMGSDETTETVTGQRAPFRPTPFDFTPPDPWACPRCGGVQITREAAPRCPTCGFRASAD